MDLQVAVYDTGFGIIAHSSAAKVMAAADTGEAGAPPSLRCTHGPQDLLGFAFHPIRELAFIFLKIVGDP